MSEPNRCKLYNNVSRYGYMDIVGRLETDYIGPWPSGGYVKLPVFGEAFFGKIRFVSNITQLEAALTELNVVGNPEGARIILAPNTYVLSSTITLQTQIIFEGEDKENTIIQASTPLTNAIIANGINGIQIKNLTISLTSGVGVTLSFTNCERCRIDNAIINVSGTNARAILLTNGIDNRITNSQFNQLDATGLRLISISGGQSNIIMNNVLTFAGTPASSTGIDSGGGNSIITNNIVNACNRGIFSNGVNSIIVGNMLNDQIASGITSQVDRNLIAGNTITNSGAGVELTGATNNVVSHNNVIGGGADGGIDMEAGSQSNLIVSNNLSNVDIGISVSAFANIIDNYYFRNLINANITSIDNASPNVLELKDNVNRLEVLADGSVNPITIPDDVEEFIITDILVGGVFTINLPAISGDYSVGRTLRITQLANSGGGTLNFLPAVLAVDSATTFALSFAGVPTAGAVLTRLGTIWRVGLAGAAAGAIA